jgi:hypothetical protein
LLVPAGPTLTQSGDNAPGPASRSRIHRSYFTMHPRPSAWCTRFSQKALFKSPKTLCRARSLYLVTGLEEIGALPLALLTAKKPGTQGRFYGLPRRASSGQTSQPLRGFCCSGTLTPKLSLILARRAGIFSCPVTPGRKKTTAPDVLCLLAVRKLHRTNTRKATGTLAPRDRLPIVLFLDNLEGYCTIVSNSIDRRELWTL